VRRAQLITIAVLILLLAACGKKDQPALEKAILVDVVPVRQGKIAKEIKFTGSIEANTEVKVFPKITATIEAMKVDLGDPIKKGDVIALLESDELRAQLAQTRAALEVMQANWGQERRSSPRQKIWWQRPGQA